MANASQWLRVSQSPYRAYEVSAKGEVRRAGRALKGHVNQYGYRTVQLYYAGIPRRFAVHRLVCEAFHGPCPDGHQCCHLDGDKRNNAADNLRWATAKENSGHKVEHGTHQAGEAHPRARLLAKDIAEIRRLHAEGLSTYSIAPKFGVHPSYVAQIVRGERWANV